ncbi:uncharacterized protein METZ01_LOCUS473340, partial [marine metagenome]
MMPIPVVGFICSLRIATLSTMVTIGYIPVIGTSIDAWPPRLSAKTNRAILAHVPVWLESHKGQYNRNCRNAHSLHSCSTFRARLSLVSLAKQPQSPQRPSAPNVRPNHVDLSVP